MLPFGYVSAFAETFGDLILPVAQLRFDRPPDDRALTGGELCALALNLVLGKDSIAC